MVPASIFCFVESNEQKIKEEETKTRREFLESQRLILRSELGPDQGGGGQSNRHYWQWSITSVATHHLFKKIVCVCLYVSVCLCEDKWPFVSLKVVIAVMMMIFEPISFSCFSSLLFFLSFLFFFYVTILRLRHLKGRVKKQKRKWRRNDVCRRCDHHLFCLLCDLGQTTCRCITQSASHGRLIAGKRRHRNGCERLWTPNRRNPNAANSQRSSSRIDWWENNDGKWPLFGHTVPSLPSVTIADGNTAAPFYYRITKNNKFEPWKKQE